MKIITNDFNLSVKEIGDLYRNRWQIELFFKWIKQHLYVKKCYGTSQNAVYNQIRAALIAYCLTLLMQLNVTHSGSLLEVLKHLRLGWEGTLDAFIHALFRPPSRSSKGRRRQDHDRCFLETLQQYETGETAHLDELTYDPVL